MPEVERVGTSAEPGAGPEGEERLGAAGRLRYAAGYDGSGAEDRDRYQSAGVGRLSVEDHGRKDDGGQTDPGEPGGFPGREPPQPRGAHGDQPAEGELARPGDGREVGDGGVRGGLGDREPVGEHDDDAERGRQGNPVSGAADLDPGDQEEESGIDDVELLLDRQRPVVLEGEGAGSSRGSWYRSLRSGSWRGRRLPSGRRRPRCCPRPPRAARRWRRRSPR